MPTLNTFIAFAGATLLLVLLPGPNLLFILGAGITGGRPTAVAAAIGVEVGTLAHVAAAALGLSAALQSSAAAFTTVKYLGVAYLVYLGISALRMRPSTPTCPCRSNESPRTVAAIRRGVLVNVLNPKVSLFFLAFLPQFIETTRGTMSQQIMLLGAVFFAIALTVDLVYAIGSGVLGRWLARRPALSRQQQRIAGGVHLALAGLALLQGSRPATPGQ